MKWVISAGFTCNGTEIYWSEDSINFERVGGIAGLCGSVSEDISYSFTHNNPISNKLNYYRLELGTNGDSQTISTFYVNLSAESHLIIPNPVKTKTTVYFRNSANRSIAFQLYNNKGQIIFERSEVFDSKIELDVALYPNGLYYFVIQSEGSNPIKGKILVEH